MLHTSNVKKTDTALILFFQSRFSESLTNEFECLIKAEKNSFRLDDFILTVEVFHKADR